ncbi:2-keto-4-pentenoate hydratase [Pleomorphomonas koreensis]|uniref:2-keto-4-pentenoate hydratase n=1 Tax=Pleomorphomonas koreensis TaxID=257440 RepID=UPI0004063AD9|nr:fumarylacetoacetate hydrolase family protein [Pleomorphomonas koreensis]
MLLIADPTAGLADRLVEARRSGAKLTAEAGLVPADAAAADAVQLAVANRLGPIGGYKVMQVGDGPGSWGAILADRIFEAPAAAAYAVSPLKVEVEVAFVLGRDLPGRTDGTPYSVDEVAEAIGGAFAAFEILESRLADDPKPSPLLVRADFLGNWGLVRGRPIAAWRAAVHSDLAVRLEIGGRLAVDQRGGHPAGDPAHALTWLANALVATGLGLGAGEVVTTGAFGGGHAIAPGETAVASIGGFEPIRFTLLAG